MARCQFRIGRRRRRKTEEKATDLDGYAKLERGVASVEVVILAHHQCESEGAYRSVNPIEVEQAAKRGGKEKFVQQSDTKTRERQERTHRQTPPPSRSRSPPEGPSPRVLERRDGRGRLRFVLRRRKRRGAWSLDGGDSQDRGGERGRRKRIGGKGKEERKREWKKREVLGDGCGVWEVTTTTTDERTREARSGGSARAGEVVEKARYRSARAGEVVERGKIQESKIRLFTTIHPPSPIPASTPSSSPPASSS